MGKVIDFVLTIIGAILFICVSIHNVWKGLVLYVRTRRLLRQAKLHLAGRKEFYDKIYR